ncbi:NAD(P)-dependent oxidoreductase [Natronosalvus halobius]|uniref:NAD(P)-dependent oxidoreductase n=1 Tax=Natronosalvus halobius TaxID=2953746 RepID=UPI00209D4A4E|nr:NAD(P)-dependent oxidoreductase [Natronosalvus halobius]USZ73578.1 NAD(P)-dependent oxidoreductase [Natronosalvus halobius]
MPQVGFIGLGDMGGPIATHLIDAGIDVTAFDLERERIEALVDAGATPADSASDAVRSADVVILSLPGPDAVNAVVDEIESAIESETILVDTTTSTPLTTERIAERLNARGADVIGAPISGGKMGAQDGTLSVMVGGDRSLFEACRPLFETFATDVFYVGAGPGDGHTAKLLNNYLSYTTLLATSEAVVLGDIAGLNRELLVDVFNASTGRSSASEEKLPEQILSGDYDTGFPLDLTEKDLRLFTQFGEECDAPLMLGSVVRYLVGYARSHQGDDADMTRVYDFVEAMMVRK